MTGVMEPERKLFVALVATLLALGTLMVHSASVTSRPSQVEEIYLSRHLLYVGLGILSAVCAALCPPRIWHAVAPLLFFGTAILLILVLVPGVGTRVKGAQRWFRLGGLSLQPSELAKIAIPLFVCALADRRRSELATLWGGHCPSCFPLLVVVPLILIQPDLGTSLFVALGGGLSLFVCGWPLRNFAVGLGAVIPAIALVILNRPYQLQRVRDFLATWSDWTQAPYHLKQSLVTLAAGGIWGTGIGRGYQKLSFLPEANTDFVFAVIGEELGLVGAAGVLVVWIVLYAAGLRLVNRLPARSFEYAAAFTLLTQIVVQAAINVAVVTALVPPKGIPHPLLSYGGTNLVVTLAAVGIVCSLTRGEPMSGPDLSAESPSSGA